MLLAARMITIRVNCRKTDKVLEFLDLSVFCFRAPYHFRNQANLLRVEVGLKGRKIRKIQSMIRQNRGRNRKRKRGRKACHDSSSEEEDEEEDEEEEEEIIAEGEIGEEMDEVVKEAVFLDDDIVHDPGFLVEEPDHSANNYLVSRKEDIDPPYDSVGDDGDDTENGTSTPETIVLDDD